MSAAGSGISREASLYDLYDPILLGRCHLIVRRKAQSPPEYIRTNPTTAVGRIDPVPDGNETVGPVEGLHVHGLPDGPSFSVEISQGIQNLLW